MALEQLELETGLNKLEFAVDILQRNEPADGYYFADSGGKDSAGTRSILIKAGVKYDAHYCVSPIDPPQIRSFLKEHHPDTQWDFHARGWWKMVEDKGLPMRQTRWCCEVIKEAGGEGRMVVTGNRRAESTKRRNQKYREVSWDGKKVFIRPILAFDNFDIWQYIRENNVAYCSLYDEGAERQGYGEGIFKRLGCVLCPFSRNIEMEELYFPKIVANWKRVCDRIVEATKARGYQTLTGKPVKNRFETGEELYQWWVKRG